MGEDGLYRAFTYQKENQNRKGKDNKTMSNFESKILTDWYNSAEFKVNICMYELLQMIENYLSAEIFNGERSCGMDNVGLLTTEVVAFNFGTVEHKKDIFGELNIPIHIPFSEIEMLIETYVLPYLEKTLDQKVVDTEIIWGKRDDGFFHIDDAEIELTLKGYKPDNQLH